jgi:hypothetical protein
MVHYFTLDASDRLGFNVNPTDRIHRSNDERSTYR